MLRIVTLFPQPLSPTSPTISPLRTSRLTPLTARVVPAIERKLTWRSRISSTLSESGTEFIGLRSGGQGRYKIEMDQKLEYGVKGVAQPVADEIEGEDGRHDKEGRRDQPRHL